MGKRFGNLTVGYPGLRGLGNFLGKQVVREVMQMGQLIVFTGPSGVGKGTLLRSLLARHPQLELSISVTTRTPREGEIEGRHYYFVNREQFQELIVTGQLLEWAEFAGNFYGTPRTPVEALIAGGKLVVLEIELEGARQVRETFPGALQLFILPPSPEELERRIRDRAQDSEEAIARRLLRAQEEIAAAGEFDIAIVNDNFDLALEAIEAALFAPVS